MFPDTLVGRAAALLSACRARGITLATAESCTGGLIAALLTEIPGSSDVIDRGFVTYSNAAKHAMLGVPVETLRLQGAVSPETAKAMAAGALARSDAGIAVAVTGIAGPGGGSLEKPVGLVQFGLAVRDGAVISAERRFGDIGRGAVRLATVETALSLIDQECRTVPPRRSPDRARPLTVSSTEPGILPGRGDEPYPSA